VSMSPEELAEIRAREQAATPGPWFSRNDPGGTCECGMDLPLQAALVVSGATTGGITLVIEDAREKENADFIAHSRQDVPNLLAEVDRLTEDANTFRRLYAEEGHKAMVLNEEISRLNAALEQFANEYHQRLEALPAAIKAIVAEQRYHRIHITPAKRDNESGGES